MTGGVGGAVKLGLIAGGGALPIALAGACKAAERPYVVLRLRGFADPALCDHPGAEVGMAELGRVLDLLRKAECKAVCFAGTVKRPDFSKLKPDLRGLKSLAGVAAAAMKGDDALLRFLLAEFEREGFAVEGAQDVADALTLAAGPLGSLRPGPEHHADIRLAVQAAKAVGVLDAGQAAVAAKGVILALEAQEGTDALLARCAGLPAALRGTPGARAGVLVKWPKPGQERRMDWPTIGVATVEGAAAAGLAGVVAEAGGALVIDRAGVIAAADRLGLFVAGLDADA